MLNKVKSKLQKKEGKMKKFSCARYLIIEI